MYSHEIQSLLDYKHNVVSIQDFCDIYDSSQVSSVFFDRDDDRVEIWTDDNYIFNFQIDFNNV